MSNAFTNEQLQQLEQLFANFTRLNQQQQQQWQSEPYDTNDNEQHSVNEEVPLPPDIIEDMEALPQNPTKAIKQFKQHIKNYEGGKWTRQGGVNGPFIKKLKRQRLESYAVIDKRYKDADRLRTCGKATTELYEDIQGILESGLEQNTMSNLTAIAEKIRSLAVFAFANAAAMDYETKQSIAKTLKLNDFIDTDTHDKEMAFDGEDVAIIQQRWHQDELIRSAVRGSKSHGQFNNNYSHKSHGYRSQGQFNRRGFGRGGGKPPTTTNNSSSTNTH